LEVVSAISSVGHTDTKFYYQCGATLLSKELAQTNQTKLTLMLTLTLTLS